MHWILQENLFNEAEWETLVGTLQRFNIPHSIHKVVPFSGDLIPEPVLLDKKVICFGSYSMRHSAKRNDWNPGVYDLFETDFEIQRERWGTLMLNFDSQVLRFKEARLEEPSFIRPVDDSKYFAGRVFDPEEFHDWQHKVVDLDLDFGTSLTSETRIQVCKPKTIFAEYRFWVVNGFVVTMSLYKRGSKVVYDSRVDEGIVDFVKRCIKIWKPHRAFVIDVAETPEGMRIVEINTINAAGFYAGDVSALVLALEIAESS